MPDGGANTDSTMVGGPGSGGSVLVTGAWGFVGRHVVAALASERPVVALDVAPGAEETRPRDLVKGSTHAANPRVLHLDLADKDATEVVGSSGGLSGVREVFHMAALASVASSFANPFDTYRVNLLGTVNLLEILVDTAPDAKVLIPSSAHVYGPPTRPDGVLDESSPLLPDNHYGVSKVAQEEIGRLFRELRKLPVFTTRAFNHVGPGQAPGFVFSDFARRLAILEAAGGGVMAVGNLDARRDFLDVRDVVRAYFTVLDRGESGVVYNVASGDPWSLRQILDLFRSEAVVDVRVTPDPALFRPTDVPVLAGDAGRLRDLGWSPRYDIRDTVRDTLDYWRQRVAEEEETSS
ncbi:MAG: GDP-mannose 4,6-dehydratase [Thermoleophilia bacterium]